MRETSCITCEPFPLGVSFRNQSPSAGSTSPSLCTTSITAPPLVHQEFFCQPESSTPVSKPPLETPSARLAVSEYARWGTAKITEVNATTTASTLASPFLAAVFFTKSPSSFFRPPTRGRAV